MRMCWRYILFPKCPLLLRITFLDVMDKYSKEKRSEIMSRIRSRNTKPEMCLRRLVHSMGFRFRLHRPDLPGRPDLVFPRHRKVIFVHGCFWHRHGCRRTSTPATNREFWEKKFSRNTQRDQENLNSLDAAGWRTLVVWECELKDIDSLIEKIKKYLTPQ